MKYYCDRVVLKLNTGEIVGDMEYHFEGMPGTESETLRDIINNVIRHEMDCSQDLCIPEKGERFIYEIYAGENVSEINRGEIILSILVGTPQDEQELYDKFHKQFADLCYAPNWLLLNSGNEEEDPEEEAEGLIF